MLIKTADDKSKRLALLEALSESTLLDARQKEWLDKEWWALKEGMRGERDAAYYLDNHLAASPNLAVLHDLRLEVEGEVAQIDHLVISRGFIFYLLETKHFNGNLHINEFGEFSVSYRKGLPRSIPSPLEQSRRHQNVLVKLLAQLGISGRTQKQPEFQHVVLVNTGAQIHRPPMERFDSSMVIKADQFDAWKNRFFDKEVTVLKTFELMMNMRGADTVKEWAQKLAREHRPQDLLALPVFMQPRVAPGPVPISAAVPRPAALAAEPAAAYAAVQSVLCADCAKPLTTAEQAFCTGNAQRFGGQMLCRAHQPVSQRAQARAAGAGSATQASAQQPRRKLECSTCGSKLSFAEGQFCWNQAQRFGGLQYCREHQAQFAASR